MQLVSHLFHSWINEYFRTNLLNECFNQSINHKDRNCMLKTVCTSIKLSIKSRNIGDLNSAWCEVTLSRLHLARIEPDTIKPCVTLCFQTKVNKTRPNEIDYQNSKPCITEKKYISIKYYRINFCIYCPYFHCYIQYVSKYDSPFNTFKGYKVTF